MKIIAGSIFVLAAAILGAAGVVRSGLGSHDYDLVYMSIGCAFLIGLVGLAPSGDRLAGQRRE